MKKLESIELTKINKKTSYIVNITEGSEDSDTYIYTGAELIEHLKDIFAYDEWKSDQKKDGESASMANFLEYVGYNSEEAFYQVYELPKTK